MIDVEVALLRLEESRRTNGAGNEGDQLAGDLYGLIQRIEDRSQLERLVAGQPNADEVVERVEQLFTADGVELNDDELLAVAGEQITAMVQRARDQLEPCGPTELEVFEKLASLPIVVVDKAVASEDGYCVDDMLGYTQEGVISPQDCDHIGECESGWPIYAESMAPGWAYIRQAFEQFAEDNAYLVRWALAPATEGALLTEPMYKIWRAGAQLWVHGDRVAVVRDAAVAATNTRYSSSPVPQLDPAEELAAWVKDVGPTGKRVAKLANDAIKSSDSKSTPLYLYLDGLELPSIPPAHGMAEWVYLTISKNPGIDLAGIEHFAHVTSLSLSDNDLTAVPDEVRKLANLDSLVLAGNPVVLPDWLGEISQLESLGLGNTRLRALPDSFAALSRLTTLLLNNNEFDELPRVLEQMSGLAVLRLDHNHIADLPDWITALDNLRELNLEQNEIGSLPDQIGDLNELRVLQLARNNIDQIPPSIGQLQNLTDLSFSGNPISALPRELLDLPETCKINLRGTELPRELALARGVSKLGELWDDFF